VAAKGVLIVQKKLSCTEGVRLDQKKGSKCGSCFGDQRLPNPFLCGVCFAVQTVLKKNALVFTTWAKTLFTFRKSFASTNTYCCNGRYGVACACLKFSGQYSHITCVFTVVCVHVTINTADPASVSQCDTHKEHNKILTLATAEFFGFGRKQRGASYEALSNNTSGRADDDYNTEVNNGDPMKALAIDDSLPVLDRIKKYIHSDIMLHRSVTL
jgi:hypothetical protein